MVNFKFKSERISLKEVDLDLRRVPCRQIDLLWNGAKVNLYPEPISLDQFNCGLDLATIEGTLFLQAMSTLKLAEVDTKKIRVFRVDWVLGPNNELVLLKVSLQPLGMGISYTLFEGFKKWWEELTEGMGGDILTLPNKREFNDDLLLPRVKLYNCQDPYLVMVRHRKDIRFGSEEPFFPEVSEIIFPIPFDGRIIRFKTPDDLVSNYPSLANSLANGSNKENGVAIYLSGENGVTTYLIAFGTFKAGVKKLLNNEGDIGASRWSSVRKAVCSTIRSCYLQPLIPMFIGGSEWYCGVFRSFFGGVDIKPLGTLLHLNKSLRVGFVPGSTFVPIQ